VLRNLRKENSILHSVIRERGLQLRKFAMTLMRHSLLPPSYDASKLAGDVHSELRLAFAERDEEIFLKEQALSMRSTQVIVLEESLTALMEQLQRADMTPCRAPSKFSVELQREREEMRGKIEAKGKKRNELKQKIDRVKSELDRVEEKMAAQRQEQQHGGGPISTAAQSAASSAADALLVLRLQKDHLTHTKDISEVQLGALESELALLQQALLSASSTMAIESGIEVRDKEQSAGVFQKIFGFGKK
jgi:chromosome segregation ATPase